MSAEMQVRVRCDSPSCGSKATAAAARAETELATRGWTGSAGRRRCPRCTRRHAEHQAREAAKAKAIAARVAREDGCE